MSTKLKFAGFVASIVAAWAAWGLYGASFVARRFAGEKPVTLTELGQAGDLFGGINALFAALAFAGVAIAAYTQWSSSHKQAFESAFFNALSLHHTIVGGLHINTGIIEAPKWRKELSARSSAPLPASNSVEGRDVFAAIVDRLASFSGSPGDTTFLYRQLQQNHNYVLGHYFRNLYQILRLIDVQRGHVVNEAEKRRFGSLLRAQLSASELTLLLLNCQENMVDEGQFRNLLVRYRMLEHLPLKRDQTTYVAVEEDLPLADEATIRTFLDYTSPQPTAKIVRGAFGTNPALQ
ncbi:putative phage abortive infection protein [Ramlibacter sp. PS3R-8]|uniref:putative phage abortive infection protein n=1 Tax=Ramlibacter sp. PS3R-8 TaxID=3133437 RepID=UPI0030967851